MGFWEVYQGTTKGLLGTHDFLPGRVALFWGKAIMLSWNKRCWDGPMGTWQTGHSARGRCSQSFNEDMHWSRQKITHVVWITSICLGWTSHFSLATPSKIPGYGVRNEKTDSDRTLKPVSGWITKFYLQKCAVYCVCVCILYIRTICLNWHPHINVWHYCSKWMYSSAWY